MKIKLNEFDKINTTFRVACSLTAIDMLMEGLGTIALIKLLSKTKIKAKTGCYIGLCALHLIDTAAKMSDEYTDAVWDISEKSCNWVFNKLENSNQKVIEFEK